MATHESTDGSIVHFEFYTEDPEATDVFHEAVFDWGSESLDEGAYTMIEPPTPPRGGVMQATDEMPPGTLPYLLVTSAEDACAAIEEAGGAVLREPFEIEDWGPWRCSRPPAASCRPSGKASPGPGGPAPPRPKRCRRRQGRP